jgi:hypothetical protein
MTTNFDDDWDMLAEEYVGAADLTPTAEPVAEPVAEPTAEPVAEPTAEPAAEPAAEMGALRSFVQHKRFHIQRSRQYRVLTACLRTTC